MAMITGIFEDVFTKKEAVNRRRNLWWRRTGIIAAFLLIDENQDYVLSEKEFVVRCPPPHFPHVFHTSVLSYVWHARLIKMTRKSPESITNIAQNASLRLGTKAQFP